MLCGRVVPAVLCGEAGAAELGAGDLFSAAADRVFRRDRFRAGDRLAGAGFAGAAVVSEYRAGRIAARSFDPLADAAADGCGDASGGVGLGAADFGRARLAERADAGD